MVWLGWLAPFKAPLSRYPPKFLYTFISSAALPFYVSPLPLSFLADVLGSSGTSGSCGAVYSSISPLSPLFFPTPVFALNQPQMWTQRSTSTYRRIPVTLQQTLHYGLYLCLVKPILHESWMSSDLFCVLPLHIYPSPPHLYYGTWIIWELL